MTEGPGGPGWALLAVYTAALAVLFVYGAHRAWLVWLYRRHRAAVQPPSTGTGFLPVVTVQLPLYNEPAVARRVIEASCAMDWPGERIQVQVLDDSTDGTPDRIAPCVSRLRAEGHDVEVIRRTVRTGFKAGALEAGLRTAKGEFVAIFDADFVPPRAFLRRTVPHLADPSVGMVQARWDHLNRAESRLTRAQAVFLDGHFVIEQGARSGAGRWMNFNGTAGVWRRSAIEDSGGWQHDTLTEDVDLSYRAQMRGWRLLFLPEVGCPGELPPEVNAFKTQQHRWTKGTIQTARKLLAPILRSGAPLPTKLEAFFHLTSPVVYSCTVVLTLLYFPAYMVGVHGAPGGSGSALFGGSLLLAIATSSAFLFYASSQAALGRGFGRTLREIPGLISLGVGISINNTRGVLEALAGRASPFVRTPKFGTDPASGGAGRTRARRPSFPWMEAAEILCGAYLTACLALSLVLPGAAAAAPLLLLFAAGYLYVGLAGLRPGAP